MKPNAKNGSDAGDGRRDGGRGGGAVCYVLETCREIRKYGDSEIVVRRSRKPNRENGERRRRS